MSAFRSTHNGVWCLLPNQRHPGEWEVPGLSLGLSPSPAWANPACRPPCGPLCFTAWPSPASRQRLCCSFSSVARAGAVDRQLPSPSRVRPFLRSPALLLAAPHPVPAGSGRPCSQASAELPNVTSVSCATISDSEENLIMVVCMQVSPVCVCPRQRLPSCP